jgi:hypothetical protein
MSAGFLRDSANKDAESAGDGPLLPPGAVPPGREPTAPADRPELARVDAELLDLVSGFAIEHRSKFFVEVLRRAGLEENCRCSRVAPFR